MSTPIWDKHRRMDTASCPAKAMFSSTMLCSDWAANANQRMAWLLEGGRFQETASIAEFERTVSTGMRLPFSPFCVGFQRLTQRFVMPKGGVFQPRTLAYRFKNPKRVQRP